MNKLEEKHFEVVTDLLMGLTAQKVAKSCTTITIEFSKGFCEWINQSLWNYDRHLKIWWNPKLQKNKTTDQLIEIYIKS